MHRVTHTRARTCTQTGIKQEGGGSGAAAAMPLPQLRAASLLLAHGALAHNAGGDVLAARRHAHPAGGKGL